MLYYYHRDMKIFYPDRTFYRMNQVKPSPKTLRKQKSVLIPLTILCLPTHVSHVLPFCQSVVPAVFINPPGFTLTRVTRDVSDVLCLV